MGIYEKPIHRKPIDFIVRTEKPKSELDTKLGRVTIGPYRDGDEQGIVDLFNLVFPVDRTLDQWLWQFRDRPHGHHTYVGRLDDGMVVSQFTSMPQLTKVHDERVHFAQIVDSLVHPDARGGLKRRGLFGLTLLNHSYEYGFKEKECVQMGLPNPWAYRLGKQTLYYVPLTKTYTHTKQVEPDAGLPKLDGDVRGLGNTYHAREIDGIPEGYAGVQEAVEARHAITAIRDEAFLTWRYLNNPHHDYRYVEIRDPGGELAGFAVLRESWLGQPCLAICEWMPSDYEGAADALIRAAEHVAKQAGMNQVKCLLNQMAPESRMFEDRDYWLERTDFRLVAHSYDPQFLTEDEINRHWYYSFGDFDVV